MAKRRRSKSPSNEGEHRHILVSDSGHGEDKIAPYDMVPVGTVTTLALELASALQRKQRPATYRDGQGKPGSKVVLQLGKPGRKPDPLYDEASQKVAAGQSIDSVFAWFCEQANMVRPEKATRDAFKAAMKRRQNKT